MICVTRGAVVAEQLCANSVGRQQLAKPCSPQFYRTSLSAVFLYRPELRCAHCGTLFFTEPKGLWFDFWQILLDF
ncbi:hypothetical protein ANN_00775 [Periplaneta americana]|uniref:Uncharacterized protein n=1 Tax=Periplaneta americana TaxID=6978 RepID=A0ABQ8TTF5_PERAM|nr:hypothetical protein ANN_00775 [Periplaneta americana]